MDQKIVDSGFKLLTGYVKRNGISSKPDEVVECSEYGFVGVACMWNTLGKRTAVRLASHSKEEARELKRRFEAWIEKYENDDAL
jgi:hypothetical protein